MENYDILNEQSVDGKVIINKLVFYFKYYWFVFLFFAVIATSIAFYINLSKNTKYKISSTISIDNNSVSNENIQYLIQTSPRFGNPPNLESEIHILASRRLIQQTLNDLDLMVSYYKLKNKRYKEIDRKAPFEVKLEPNHYQLVNAIFEVKFIDNTNCEIKLCSDEALIYHYLKNTESKIIISDHSKKRFKTNNLIRSNDYCFSITIDEDYNFSKNNIWYFKFHQPQQLTDFYHKTLKIDPYENRSMISGSNILRLEVETYNPIKDAIFINRLVDNYIENDLSEKNRKLRNSIDFADNQLTIVASKLDSIGKELELYQTGNQVYSPSFEAQQYLTKLDHHESIKLREEGKLNYLNSLIEKLNNSSEELFDIPSPASIGITEPIINKLLDEIVTLANDIMKLRIVSNENHPLIIGKRSLYEEKKSLIKSQLNNQISHYENLILHEKKEINRLSSNLNKMPTLEHGMVTLQRQFYIQENLYTRLLEFRNNAEIEYVSNISEIKVIETANPKYAQILPSNKMLNYIVAIFIALLLPFLSIYIFDFFNNKIKSIEEIEAKCEVPVMGSIPLLEKNNTFLPAYNNPNSFIANSFRVLSTGIRYLNKENNCFTILFTSGNQIEGKTFCSINLASMLPVNNKNVLLIDLDLRKPKVATYFSLDKSLGLVDYLTGRTDLTKIIHKSQIANFDILTAGTFIHPNPAELILEDKFCKLIEKLKKKYDYIVIDTCPVGIINDGIELMKYSDINLYIVRQNQSRINSLKIVNEACAKMNIKNTHIVLNGLKMNGLYGYKYNYAYYDEPPRQKVNLSKFKWLVKNTQLHT